MLSSFRADGYRLQRKLQDRPLPDRTVDCIPSVFGFPFIARAPLSLLVRQVTHHLPEGTAPHRLHPPPLARIDENPPLDPGSD